ncbi:MAG: hypothetical protein JWM68_4739 [Verrucomicrobiales bacterium]|nr:hypothetical protein [Verrucomicrobiales bacterium]
MNKRALTPHEKKTVRRAAVVIGIYLVLFCGFKAVKFLQGRRSEYQQLQAQALLLKQHIAPYQAKVLVTTKLMETFHLDPAKLTRGTVVAEASAAIQKAAMAGGIQVGTVREAAARSGGSAKEVATVQFDGAGQVPALMNFLHQIQTLGYPLVVDSVQLSPDTSRPGQTKMNLTIVILDFEQWKTEEVPHA